MIGACDSCGSEDVETRHTKVPIRVTESMEGDYCDVCLSISAVSAGVYGRTDASLLNALAFCTNTIVKAINQGAVNARQS